MEKLKWGETPWDDLPREDLLREVQRMFSALESARNVLRILKAAADPTSLFWSQQGSGGRALDHAEQVADALYAAYDAEDIYRSFFRYATSLLFDVPDEEKWVVCSFCGRMWSGRDTAQRIGTPCTEFLIPTGTCTGVLRWLEWGDLAKKE